MSNSATHSKLCLWFIILYIYDYFCRSDYIMTRVNLELYFENERCNENAASRFYTAMARCDAGDELYQWPPLCWLPGPAASCRGVLMSAGGGLLLVVKSRSLLLVV